MSIYREQATEFNDRRCLIDALKECSTRSGKHFEPVEHSTPVPLEGYHGDKRQQTAEIVIPREQVQAAANDIGFAKQPDGTYKAIISDYDSGFYNQKWLIELKKIYSEKKAMQSARVTGSKLLAKQTASNGDVKLRFLVQH